MLPLPPARTLAGAELYCAGLCCVVQATVAEPELRNAGPEPKRFTVADGQLLQAGGRPAWRGARGHVAGGCMGARCCAASLAWSPGGGGGDCLLSGACRPHGTGPDALGCGVAAAQVAALPDGRAVGLCWYLLGKEVGLGV